jgi:hypothetical protein
MASYDLVAFSYDLSISLLSFASRKHLNCAVLNLF